MSSHDRLLLRRQEGQGRQGKAARAREVVVAAAAARAARREEQSVVVVMKVLWSDTRGAGWVAV